MKRRKGFFPVSDRVTIDGTIKHIILRMIPIIVQMIKKADFC